MLYRSWKVSLVISYDPTSVPWGEQTIVEAKLILKVRIFREVKRILQGHNIDL